MFLYWFVYKEKLHLVLDQLIKFH